MKPFVDTGFLLTLLFQCTGSTSAWNTVRRMSSPLFLSHLQNFTTQNRFIREMESSDTPSKERAVAAAALQRFRNYLDEQIFAPDRIDPDIAIQLAFRWQFELAGNTPQSNLLLWPAMAVAGGAPHFLSFDPRTRNLAKSSGPKIVPERI